MRLTGEVCRGAGGLARGDSFLLNLTVATGLDTDWTLEEIFHRAQSPLTACWFRDVLSVSLRRFLSGWTRE